MRIVITGGHFSPAYSVIHKLKDNNKLLVIGRKNAFDNDSAVTFEYKTCQNLGIPFEVLTTGRLRRNFGIDGVSSLAKFPFGVYQSLKILKKFSPGVVITFGGYIGLPVAIAASILKIPVVLHEQTQKAGLSSRLISQFAAVVLISFPSSEKYFKNRNIVLTGNPLRPEFFEKTDYFLLKKPSIYITGGSTGSHIINNAVEKILPVLLSKYQVFHQTGNAQGSKDFETLKKFENESYCPSEFFAPDKVFELLRKVDLVISRSGINTVCEIIASKAVSLLVPIKVGQVNEQLDNAIFVKELGIGDLLDQDDITPEVLLKKIDDMINNKAFYKKNFEKAQKYITLDAAEKIVKEIYKYGKGKRSDKTPEDE